MEARTLKIIAAIFSLLGSGLLAWRVKGLLEALALVVATHEANIQQLMRPNGDIVNLANSTKHVERARKFGLLVFGFICLAISAALQLIALLASSS
jgi:hypothetical protein